MNALWEKGRADRKVIFKYICDLAMRGRPTPSHAEIAQATGIGETPVRKHMLRLKRDGMISVSFFCGNRPKTYTVNTPDGPKSTAARAPIKRGPGKESSWDGLPPAGAYGDRPIARMRDRDKAEELIAKIFSGELTEKQAQKAAKRRIYPKRSERQAGGRI